jgi:hypothetical protein
METISFYLKQEWEEEALAYPSTAIGMGHWQVLNHLIVLLTKQQVLQDRRI